MAEKRRRRTESVKQRIAMVSTHGYVAANPPLGAPDTGGQVVYVIELSKKLAQLGYKVDIWTRRFEDQPEIDDINEDVRVIRARCGGKEFIPKEYLYRKLPEWTENALRHIKKHNLDYQFINSHYWDAGLAAQHLAEDLDVPHVHTPHSLGIWKKRQMEADHPEDQHTFEEKYNFSRRIHHEMTLYKEADLVIATTPPQYDIVVSDYHVPAEDVRMIPPGYDDNRFFPVSEPSRRAARERLGFKPKTVASVGRLAENKGFDLLVDAFSVVASRENDAHLRLAVGVENPDQPPQLLKELKQKIKDYGLGSRVEISGSVSDEELPDYYRAADVFALPSRYEPFGMTAIEAMASGTPTVITVHGGLYRAVAYGEHGLYADSFDKEDFGITLLKPLRYPGIRSRLSRNGSHRVRSLFTWTGIAQQLLKAIEGRDSASFNITRRSYRDLWVEES